MIKSIFSKIGRVSKIQQNLGYGSSQASVASCQENAIFLVEHYFTRKNGSTLTETSLPWVNITLKSYCWRHRISSLLTRVTHTTAHSREQNKVANFFFHFKRKSNGSEVRVSILD